MYTNTVKIHKQTTTTKKHYDDVDNWKTGMKCELFVWYKKQNFVSIGLLLCVEFCFV